jgi:hypothetical protein
MIPSSWRLAGLGLAVGLACGEAEGTRPNSLPDGAGARSSCDVSACGALAGPCQVGLCDEPTADCRLAAAREGEPCLQGNACGPAVCRSGECSALEPPSCPTADQCRVAVCRPERGECVSEPLRVPGATCQTALALQGVGTSAVDASSLCGDHTRQPLGCSAGLLGPSTHFALDLRGANAPKQVVFVIDANFSFEAALGRGPCGDTTPVACATAFQRDRLSRSLSVTLSPDYYELVVTGRGESDHGTVHVAAAVEPASGSTPPVNDECDAGLPVNGALPVQTIIGNAGRGNGSMPTRCIFGATSDVFYELDLSSRATPTLLEVDLAGIDNSVELAATLFAATGSGCGEYAVCGSNFVSRLLPGRYRIGISQAVDFVAPSGWRFVGEYVHTEGTDNVPQAPFALRLRLRDADCAATTNDTWQTAIELDPNIETQRLVGNTACASDDSGAACSNPDRGAPDLFYRLDLRGHTAPRHLYLNGRSDTDLVAYVLSTDAAGAPIRAAGCESLAPSTHVYLSTDDSALFELAPRLYYLVIDGRDQNAGRFDLEIHLSEAELPQRCVDASRPACLDQSEPACADSRASPACLSTALECGLNPAVYAAFCAGFAGCCEGTADLEGCRAAWSANVECQ